MSDTTTYVYAQLAEDAIQGDDDRMLREGLAEAFVPFDAARIFAIRRWWQYRPSWRWLVRDGCGAIVAQASLHEVTIDTACGPLRMIGVAEVFVRPAHRGHGLVRGMLERHHGETHGYAWSGLFGEQRVYRSSGYRPVEAAIIVQGERRHPHNFQVHALDANASWPAGDILIRGPTW